MRFALPMPAKSLHPVVRVLMALVGAAAFALLIVFGALALLVLLSVGVVALMVGRWKQTRAPSANDQASAKPRPDPNVLEGEFVVRDKHPHAQR